MHLVLYSCNALSRTRLQVDKKLDFDSDDRQADNYYPDGQ